MVGDYISTSFTGDGIAHPVFNISKPPTGRSSCYVGQQPPTGCSQRLASASFDITAPQMTPSFKSQTGPVLSRARQTRPAKLVTAN
jgi:hypothetical protein